MSGDKFNSVGSFHTLSDDAKLSFADNYEDYKQVGKVLVFLNRENLEKYINNEDKHKSFNDRKYLTQVLKEWEERENG